VRVFKNRVLRGIFGPKRDEVRGEWIKLHNGEFHYLYFSPSIVRAIKSRGMRWEGHVRMGRGEVYTGVWLGNLRERDCLEDPDVDGRIISLGSGVWEQRVDRSGSGQGQVADICKRGNEPSGSIKCGEFLDYLRTG